MPHYSRSSFVAHVVSVVSSLWWRNMDGSSSSTIKQCISLRNRATSCATVERSDAYLAPGQARVHRRSRSYRHV